MREASNDLAYFEIKSTPALERGWVQAGFKSFAYRLAHLVLPRYLVVSAVAVVFYMA